jgi:hypothetical protein
MADSRTHLYANDARTTLASDLAEDTVALQIADHFEDFPSPAVDEIFKVTIEDPTTGVREVCNCTARADGVLTVERGQENTTAIAWAAGVIVAHRNTAGTMEHLEESGGGGGYTPTEITARGQIEATGFLGGAPNAGIANISWDCGTPGFYMIEFVENYFSDTPIVVATTGTPGLIASVQAMSQTATFIQLTTHEGNPADGLFLLIAIGPIGSGVPTPAILNFGNHTINSGGANGSGSQEPLLNISFGNGDFAPLGQLWVGGGGNGYFFEVDSDSLDPGGDPMSFRNYGTFIENEWWQGSTETLAPGNYEIRLTVLSGDAPMSGDNIDEWLIMDVERGWSYIGVFDDTPRTGVWRIEIRATGVEDILATGDLTVAQVFE